MGLKIHYRLCSDSTMNRTMTTVINKVSIIAISSLLLIALTACGNDPMHSPLAAGDQVELTQSLLDLKGQLSGKQYSELVESVAIIRTYDMESLSVEQYYASLSDKTPMEIIARAHQIQAEVQAQSQVSQE